MAGVSGALRVMLVDDDAGFLGLVDAIFRRAKEDRRDAFGRSFPAELEITTAGDGFIARELLGTKLTDGNRPDLLVVDLKMPRLDGIGLLKWIREEPRLVTVPVLMLSTSATGSDVASSYAAGCNAYYQKPLRFEDLERLVGELVHHWTQWARLFRRPG
ncbi:MAG: response regulator [Planctomycetota bacterium]|nr:response regulator [Planctomycetota bacterium]